MMPEMTAVQSSNAEAIGYDEENRVLYVRFHENRRGEKPLWKYTPVDRRDYEALMQGLSVGQFVSQLKKDPMVLAHRVALPEETVSA